MEWGFGVYDFYKCRRKKHEAAATARFQVHGVAIIRLEFEGVSAGILPLPWYGLCIRMGRSLSVAFVSILMWTLVFLLSNYCYNYLDPRSM